MIVELNDDIEKNNIQGSLLLDHFANLLRNYIFFTSLLGHAGRCPLTATPTDKERRISLSVGRLSAIEIQSWIRIMPITERTLTAERPCRANDRGPKMQPWNPGASRRTAADWARDGLSKCILDALRALTRKLGKGAVGPFAKSRPPPRGANRRRIEVAGRLAEFTREELLMSFLLRSPKTSRSARKRDCRS